MATHFVEEERRVRRFEGRLIYWCPICHAAHGLTIKRGKPEPIGEPFAQSATPEFAYVPV